MRLPFLKNRTWIRLGGTEDSSLIDLIAAPQTMADTLRRKTRE